MTKARLVGSDTSVSDITDTCWRQTRFTVNVPLRSRSREDGRAFHLRRRVFDLRRWTFAPRSRSVVGGRVDQRQLSLRRAEIGGVVAFGETAHDLAEQLVRVG